MASMAMLNNQRVEVQPQMWYFTCFNSGKLYQISQKKNKSIASWNQPEIHGVDAKCRQTIGKISAMLWIEAVCSYIQAMYSRGSL